MKIGLRSQLRDGLRQAIGPNGEERARGNHPTAIPVAAPDPSLPSEPEAEPTEPPANPPVTGSGPAAEPEPTPDAQEPT